VQALKELSGVGVTDGDPLLTLQDVFCGDLVLQQVKLLHTGITVVWGVTVL
jgi:hypothetical protein